jgi:hypothetical protein
MENIAAEGRAFLKARSPCDVACCEARVTPRANIQGTHERLAVQLAYRGGESLFLLVLEREGVVDFVDGHVGWG